MAQPRPKGGFAANGKPRSMAHDKMIPAVARDKDARAELGSWLRTLREAQGLSQRQLADTLDLDYYTFISQLETGRGKIPSARYRDWAKALKQEPKAFMTILLSYYEPEAYEMLFGDTQNA
eukprot:CAMPEP_0184452450 /NCGR_PEP_ID=MMETSP0740-20130409/12879_1 /TAXON_ID=385413 /ORGANISM="Thalassiosira miniscula, Strain CCMP1093" /LENGTH=120 /DNA_ID=CAMNT_0026823345 /DNA_START=47 /DNA_END=409 /DNA_ORIENTATION=+